MIIFVNLDLLSRCIELLFTYIVLLISRIV